jgi:hypothetical protein
MILAHYNLDKAKVYKILERFYIKFKRRRTFKPNPNGSPPCIDEIKIIKIYKRSCKYVNETENKMRENLVIKLQLNSNLEYYNLNVLYEDYKDLL